MQKITWEINELFIFPETYGCPVKANEIHVKPRWEQQVDDLSVSLSGIYHLSAFLEFDVDKEREKQLSNECTLIDEVEWQDKQAYFEYAIPLDVNLPKERVVHSTIQLNTRDIDVQLRDDGICHIKCQVDCLYDEVQDESSEVVQSYESNTVIHHSETVSDPVSDSEITEVEESILSEFLWDLEEHYTRVEIPLNKVRY
ncbi:hypothetical protein [Rummeliibacillus pycnus]|uniref:hypothetical protein n=1 Tax=Rummeliibacillus pycnus TaxID=101070 RepID=UPI000C9B6D61|nr:hypothetical protein [Rummeliibacillus pycnus]